MAGENKGKGRNMKRFQIRYRSIFARTLVTFLVILLPLVLTGVVIHEWGLRMVREQITGTMQAQTAHSAEMLERELARVQALQDDLLVDDDLLFLAGIPDAYGEFEKVQAINRLRARARTFLNSSVRIEDVVVILSRLDRAISAKNGVEPLTDTQRSLLDGFTQKAYSEIKYRDGQLFTLVKNPYSSSVRKRPLFVIQMVLSNEMLEKSFEALNVTPDSHSFLFCPSNGFSLGQEGAESLKEDLEQHIGNLVERETSFQTAIRVNRERHLVFGRRFDFREPFWLVATVPEQQVLMPIGPYIRMLWLFVAASLVIVVVFAKSTHQYLQKPMQRLVEAFRHVEAGDLETPISHEAADEFGYLYQQFNRMLEKLHHLIHQVYTQTIMSQRAELKQLQSQINPHFLYNSFFILQRMIQGGDHENAQAFSSYLGKYFQYVTRNARDVVPLRLEVEHARNYLDIQQVRFSNIRVEVEELPESMRNLPVPRLILQPIIENAFEHAFRKDTANRDLALRFFHEAECTCIRVENSGQPEGDEAIRRMNEALSNEALSNGPLSLEDLQPGKETTGLVNIHKRLRLMFGETGGLFVSRSETGGWQVEIRIPQQPDKETEQPALTGGGIHAATSDH